MDEIDRSYANRRCARKAIRWLAALLLMINTPTLMAQSNDEIVLRQPPFEFYSAFWPNLHNLLWAEAWARRPTEEQGAAGSLSEPLVTAQLTEAERAAWDAAVSYYDREIADLHLLFEMSDIRKATIQASEELPTAGLEAAHREALLAAAPVYRRHWWSAHDRANRAWAENAMRRVASTTPTVPDRLAQLYGSPWFTEVVRVDVVRVGAREGAYTSIDPAPAHITISSSSPNNAAWMGVEVLFHEASHALVFPLIEAFDAELRARQKTAPDLWHVALFYLTGEVVRQTLASEDVVYSPYLYATGLFDRAWPQFKLPIENYWQAYVDGSISRSEAIEKIVEMID